MLTLTENLGHAHVAVSDTLTLTLDNRVRGRLKVVRTPGKVARNARDGADEDQGAVAAGHGPHRGAGPAGLHHDVIQLGHRRRLRRLGRGPVRKAGSRQQNEGGQGGGDSSHVYTCFTSIKPSNDTPISGHKRDSSVMMTAI